MSAWDNIDLNRFLTDLVDRLSELVEAVDRGRRAVSDTGLLFVHRYDGVVSAFPCLAIDLDRGTISTVLDEHHIGGDVGVAQRVADGVYLIDWGDEPAQLARLAVGRSGQPIMVQVEGEL